MMQGNKLPTLKKMIVPALFVGALFATIFMREPTVVDDGIRRFEGDAMGTHWTLKIASKNVDAEARQGIQATIEGTLSMVDGSMSTYRPDSELMRFNQNKAWENFKPSKPLATVMTEAMRISELTEGAFDVTVGPLVDAWGFGPSGHRRKPDEIALRSLGLKIGYQKLIVNAEGMKKRMSGMQCDLSAIAKGYAVDQVTEAVEALGYANFMVEVGGEIVARGVNATGKPWRIGIERPDPTNRTISRVVDLSNMALATSGDYRNYREIDGKRVSHVLDPRTRRPIAHRLASVSVLHPSCMTADAWATALNVLGDKEGLAVATSQDLAALFIVRRPGGEFIEVPSPAFERLTATKPAAGDGDGQPESTP